MRVDSRNSGDQDDGRTLPTGFKIANQRRPLYVVSGLLFAASGGLLAFGYVTAARQTAPSSGGVLEFAQPVIDLGDRPREASPTVTFELVNRHPVPVTCGPVVNKCSCSSASLQPSVIPPGGRATLQVTWQLAGKRGPSTETLAVPYSGPNGVGGFVTAKLTARVLCPIDLDERQPWLSKTRRTTVVGLNSPLGRPFRCTGAVSGHPAVRCTVTPNGQAVELDYDYDAAPWQSGSVMVTVWTDQADDRQISFNVRIDADRTH